MAPSREAGVGAMSPQPRRARLGPVSIGNADWGEARRTLVARIRRERAP